MSAYDNYIEEQRSGQNDPTEYLETPEETAERLSREWRRSLRNRNLMKRILQRELSVIGDEVEEGRPE